MRVIHEMMEVKMDTAMSVAQKAMKTYRRKVGSLSHGHTEMKAGKEIKTAVRASQKNMEAAANSILFELEKTIKNRVEDILASVDHGALNLDEEVNSNPEKNKAELSWSNTVLPFAD